MATMKIAVLQTKVYGNKMKNMERLKTQLEQAAKERVDLVTLPEMFNCPYEASNFPIYGEPEGGECWQICSRLAAQYGIYLSAGSMPEKDETGLIYNTAYVFDRKGKQIAKHRKIHLFDIEVQNGQQFKESDTLAAGKVMTVFDTQFGRMGLCICYDLRFPELVRLMALDGAKIILVPAAFNMTTGPAHWNILFRSRALDNQAFVVGTAPARDLDSPYHSYGHSIAVSPWGDVVGELDEKEGLMIRELDLDRLEQVRKQLPLLAHRRTDLYRLELRK